MKKSGDEILRSLLQRKPKEKRKYEPRKTGFLQNKICGICFKIFSNNRKRWLIENLWIILACRYKLSRKVEMYVCQNCLVHYKLGKK